MPEKKMEGGEESPTMVNEIDKAINAARARKASKGGAGTAPAAGEVPEATAAAPPLTPPKKAKPTEAEKAAKKQAFAEERATSKALRTSARDVRRAEKLAARSPAHMKKVLRAAERLGTLGQAALLLFNEATANLPAAELTMLALHIQQFNRIKATERALDRRLDVGQQVTIIAGDPRYIGRTGTVTKSQRIRCYVAIDGIAKAVYMFTSDVQDGVGPTNAELENEVAAG